MAVAPYTCNWDPRQLLQTHSQICLQRLKRPPTVEPPPPRFRAYILLGLYQKFCLPSQHTKKSALNLWQAKARRQDRCQQAIRQILTAPPICQNSFFYRIKIYCEGQGFHPKSTQTQQQSNSLMPIKQIPSLKDIAAIQINLYSVSKKLQQQNCLAKEKGMDLRLSSLETKLAELNARAMCLKIKNLKKRRLAWCFEKMKKEAVGVGE